MSNESNHLLAFGKCRLDTVRRVLWCEEEPVGLPLKSLELLCLLVERGGQVVTKEEIWQTVWPEAFVEETNLTHNIYLLRKTLKDLGEADLIETVPRRGYRFAGAVRELGNAAVILEKRTLHRTNIHIEEEAATELPAMPARRLLPRLRVVPRVALAASLLPVVLLVSVFVSRNYRRAPAPATINSLAVLPFTTIAGAPDDEHRGLGLADVLITRLSNLKNVNVRPTSAIAAFESQAAESTEIGRKLQADAVLEGTIYRSATQVRVTVRLLQTSDNKPLWAGQFERSLQDEMKLQNEIALQVADALTLNLSGGERDALTKPLTDDRDALALYQKGRFEWNKRNYQGAVEAERLFRNAIEKDPHFALAYVGLADTLAMRNEASEALAAAGKALELDPNLAEAHATRGFFWMFHYWDWKKADSELKKSIELNGGSATAHHWYAILLEIEGRNAEAKAELTRALEINPLSYNFLADLGQVYYHNREYERAKEYCQKALEIYPDFNFAHDYLYRTYLQTGEYDAAVEAYLKAEEARAFSLPHRTSQEKQNIERELAGQREIYQKGGIKTFLENLRQSTAQNADGFYFSAMVYAFSGEKEKALGSLEKAFEGKARFSLPFVKADPVFDNLRDEPRFQEILRKMNL
jgi:DNA-binding winged helix-turn-helix (wHTH) protein/TolB-like protein/Tfp pilus assembly protein PilF